MDHERETSGQTPIGHHGPTSERMYIADMRGRLGLEPGDTSRDHDIEAMTPMQRFELLCGWHFGYSGWSRTILNWAKDAGLKISPTERTMTAPQPAKDGEPS